MRDERIIDIILGSSCILIIPLLQGGGVLLRNIHKGSSAVGSTYDSVR